MTCWRHILLHKTTDAEWLFVKMDNVLGLCLFLTRTPWTHANCRWTRDDDFPVSDENLGMRDQNATKTKASASKHAQNPKSQKWDHTAEWVRCYVSEMFHFQTTRPHSILRSFLPRVVKSLSSVRFTQGSGNWGFRGNHKRVWFLICAFVTPPSKKSFP